MRPGYEGVACSDDGLTWRRAKNTPILAVQDSDSGNWEKDCIYQPWLVEHSGRFFDFYNAANGGVEQTGLAFSTDLLSWTRHPGNPVIRNRQGGYDQQFCSDPKVFRDGDHWTMFYFGVGRGGAHIMAAFSRDLVHWTAHPEPLYKAGGNPSGLDKQYAHKISLVYNPKDETYLHVLLRLRQPRPRHRADYQQAAVRRSPGNGLPVGRPFRADQDGPEGPSYVGNGYISFERSPNAARPQPKGSDVQNSILAEQSLST